MTPTQIIMAAVVLFVVFLIGRASVRRKPQKPRRGRIHEVSHVTEKQKVGSVQSGDPQDMLDSLDPEAHATVVDRLKKGRKIEAIKEMRVFTGRGLKEAKDAVELLERQI